MAEMIELEVRPILGNGGTVTLYARVQQDAAGRSESFAVTLLAHDGTQITARDFQDGSEALSFFAHPFADPQTPDVFRRAGSEPELTEDETTDETEMEARA